MKTEKEVKEQIHLLEIGVYKTPLNRYPATIQINAPVALMQVEAKAKLDSLYWVLGEKRPKFKCDEWDKQNR